MGSGSAIAEILGTLELASRVKTAPDVKGGSVGGGSKDTVKHALNSGVDALVHLVGGLNNNDAAGSTGIDGLGDVVFNTAVV